MANVKRRWDRLSNEDKAVAKNELIQFFEHERDERIGVIAAEEILNHFLQTVGVKLYNQGVRDAKETLEKRMEDLNYDLDDLFDL